MIFSSPFFLQGKDLKEAYQYILSFTPFMSRDTEMMSSIYEIGVKKFMKILLMKFKYTTEID